MTEIGEVSWNERLEEYFASTGEKAHCLGWIHKRSEEIFSVRRTFIDLPVIVGSGVIAFLNAASPSLFENNEKLASISLGIGSLIVGIINTFGTYFAWAKRAEGHRISALQYARLYRFLSIEMSLPREERMSPSDLLKYTKDNYDRLQEISPLIPPEVRSEFQRRFGGLKGVSQPEEVNGLEKIEVFQDPPLLKIRVPLSASSPRVGTLRRNQSEVSVAPPAPPYPENELERRMPLSQHIGVVDNVLSPVAGATAEPRKSDTHHMTAEQVAEP
jgi:hypothetical protein